MRTARGADSMWGAAPLMIAGVAAVVLSRPPVRRWFDRRERVDQVLPNDAEARSARARTTRASTIAGVAATVLGAAALAFEVSGFSIGTGPAITVGILALVIAGVIEILVYEDEVRRGRSDEGRLRDPSTE